MFEEIFKTSDLDITESIINKCHGSAGLRATILGHQVEDPEVFVWSIDWESFDNVATFTNSREYKTFMVSLGQMFDLGKAAPLRLYSHFIADTTAAFQAGATEVAIYTLPTVEYTEEAKIVIDKATDVPGMEGIKQFGSGGATGWVFATRNAAEPEGHSMALLGVLGYPTVEHHTRWRESPEHAQVMNEMGSSALINFDMWSANVPGGGLFVPDESMFHVKFQIGT